MVKCKTKGKCAISGIAFYFVAWQTRINNPMDDFSSLNAAKKEAQRKVLRKAGELLYNHYSVDEFDKTSKAVLIIDSMIADLDKQP